MGSQRVGHNWVTNTFLFVCFYFWDWMLLTALSSCSDLLFAFWLLRLAFNPFAAAAKPFQSCPTRNPKDSSPPGSPVPGILQARTLEWVAISFSNAWKWKVKVKSLSRVRFFVTPWTAAYQAPPSMGISRQEYWSGLLFPSPEILIDEL